MGEHPVRNYEVDGWPVVCEAFVDPDFAGEWDAAVLQDLPRSPVHGVTTAGYGDAAVETVLTDVSGVVGPLPGHVFDKWEKRRAEIAGVQPAFCRAWTLWKVFKWSTGPVKLAWRQAPNWHKDVMAWMETWGRDDHTILRTVYVGKGMCRPPFAPVKAPAPCDLRHFHYDINVAGEGKV